MDESGQQRHLVTNRRRQVGAREMTSQSQRNPIHQQSAEFFCGLSVVSSQQAEKLADFLLDLRRPATQVVVRQLGNEPLGTQHLARRGAASQGAQQGQAVLRGRRGAAVAVTGSHGARPDALLRAALGHVRGAGGPVGRVRRSLFALVAVVSD